MHIPLNEGEDAELEFRKAYYKLKFDRVWNSEIQRIENENYTIMGAILAFAKAGQKTILADVDPLTLSNSPTEYSYEPDLTFLKDLSEELLLMLCQSFRAKFGRKTTAVEIKHQRLLDKIQQIVNANTYKAYSVAVNNAPVHHPPGSVASGSGTNKNLRNVIGKDSTRSKGGDSTGTFTS